MNLPYMVLMLCYLQICGKKNETKDIAILTAVWRCTWVGHYFVGEQVCRPCPSSFVNLFKRKLEMLLHLADFLKTSYKGSSDILFLKEDMNFNSRAADSVSSAFAAFGRDRFCVPWLGNARVFFLCSRG